MNSIQEVAIYSWLLEKPTKSTDVSCGWALLGIRVMASKLTTNPLFSRASLFTSISFLIVESGIAVIIRCLMEN